MDSGQAAKGVPIQNQLALKIGAVTQVYYPDDPKNLSKIKIEYDILVKERSGTGGMAANLYRNCVTSDLFGGMADFLEFTHRPMDKKEIVDPLYNKGSTVLILCLHGDASQAYIVGGQRHNRISKKSNKDRGHFLEFEFNGINVEINKDGELTLTYKSRTNIEGVPQDTTSGSTFIKIDKTGSIELNDAKACHIRIDKPTSDITIQTTQHDIYIDAKRDLNVHTGRDTNITVEGQAKIDVTKDTLLTVGGKLDAKVKKDALILVEGKTDLTSKGKIDIKTDSETFITSKGKIDVNTSADAFITASGKVKIKAPLIEETNGSTSANDGVINGTSIDPFTGVPHIDFSSIVRAKK